MVTIEVKNSGVELYDKERTEDDDTDSKTCLLTGIDHDISDTVLHMMDLASKIAGVEFSEDQIEGGVESIAVDTDEDMLVAMCYVARCTTFAEVPTFDEAFNITKERAHILDTLFALLEFQ